MLASVAKLTDILIDDMDAYSQKKRNTFGDVDELFWWPIKMRQYICAALLLLSGFAALAGDFTSVAVSYGRAYVTTPGGKRQVIPLKNGATESSAKFIDLRFNGYADLLILRDRGASQEFYDVYLYSKEKDEYIYNKPLSDIPCLSVDKKNKEVVGKCFHESACENWEEYYSVSPQGDIYLIERKGTYCDPIGGKGYTYIDLFRNGEKTSSKTSPLNNQSDN